MGAFRSGCAASAQRGYALIDYLLRQVIARTSNRGAIEASDQAALPLVGRLRENPAFYR